MTDSDRIQQAVAEGIKNNAKQIAEIIDPLNVQNTEYEYDEEAGVPVPTSGDDDDGMSSGEKADAIQSEMESHRAVERTESIAGPGSDGEIISSDIQAESRQEAEQIASEIAADAGVTEIDDVEFQTEIADGLHEVWINV